MLRISIIESGENRSTVKLEGNLTGAWTEEFKAACEGVFAAGRSLSLDLWDVMFIDRPALDFLVSLATHAATQVHCSSFHEEQLKQAAANPKAPRQLK